MEQVFGVDKFMSPASPEPNSTSGLKGGPLRLFRHLFRRARAMTSFIARSRRTYSATLRKLRLLPYAKKQGL